MDLKHVELNHVGSVRGRTKRKEKQFVIFVLLIKASYEKRSLVQSLRLKNSEKHHVLRRAERRKKVPQKV